MKKKINKPMRAAGILLVATMLSTCLTAGTFAKYTTTDSATDTARVAKFGVVVNANGLLFGNEYVAGAVAGSVPTAYTTTGSSTSGSVQAYSKTAGGDVVAPGTKSNSGFGFSVNGTPEVDVTVAYNVLGDNIRLTNGQWAVLVPVTFNTKDELVAAVANTSTDTTGYGTSGSIVRLKSGTGDGRLFERVTATNQDTVWTNIATETLYKITTFVNAAEDYFPVKYQLTDGQATPVSTPATPSVNSNSLNNVIGQYATLLTPGNTPTSITGYTDNTTSLAKTYTTTVKANNKLDTTFNMGSSTLSWQWDYTSTTDATIDPKDTILGDLVSQYNAGGVNGATAHNETFSGIVVKYKTLGGNTAWMIPIEDTTQAYTVGTTNLNLSKGDKDFNLNTNFYIDCTVTQVD